MIEDPTFWHFGGDWCLFNLTLHVLFCMFVLVCVNSVEKQEIETLQFHVLSQQSDGSILCSLMYPKVDHPLGIGSV